MKFRIKISLTGIIVAFAAMIIPADCIYAQSPECAMPVENVMATDSAEQDSRSVEFVGMPWWRQLIANGFHINDPRVNYPAFPRFLVKVYDWGDRVFNSYDPEYVVGTGKNWKVMAKNYNWFESYMLMYSFDDRLNIRSQFYTDIGAYLNFMAVSVGYTAKIGNLFGKGRSPRTNFNFSFTCSRFQGSFDLTTTKGNTHITRLGNYHDGKHIYVPFHDISQRSMNGHVLYFFNNYRYSHAAAYCFSKYQLKSAGTWVGGAGINYQDIEMDFESLPDEMKSYLPGKQTKYTFKYCDYVAYGGYAYNFVLKPRRWLINVMGVPAVGYRHAYSQSNVGSKSMFALNGNFSCAAVYNYKALFASVNANVKAHVYFGGDYTFFNSLFSTSFTVGARF